MRARRCGKASPRKGNDGTAGHEACHAAVRLQAAVAGAPGARIDAENPHAREASISFSSTSKLAQTLLDVVVVLDGLHQLQHLLRFPAHRA